MKEWFKSSYGAGNVVVVIAGDIDAQDAKEKVEKYFGDIAPGPPVAHFEKWVAQTNRRTASDAQDRVPQTRLYKVWNVPGLDTHDALTSTLLSTCSTRTRTVATV